MTQEKIFINKNKRINVRAAFSLVINKLKYHLWKDIKILVFVAVCGASLYLASQVTNRRYDKRTQASISEMQASVLLYPKEAECGSDKSVYFYPKITFASNKKIGFAKLSFRFQPEILKFREVAISRETDNLAYLKSSVVNNAPDSATLVVFFGTESTGKAPSAVANLSKTVFEKIKLDSVSSITLVKEDSQIVFMDGSNAEIKVENELQVSCLPTATPTQAVVVATNAPVQPTLSPTVIVASLTPSPTITLPVPSITESIPTPTAPTVTEAERTIPIPPAANPID